MPLTQIRTQDSRRLSDATRPSGRRRLSCFLVVALVLVLAGCTGIPKGVTPVTEFDLNRYLGSWYEIARLDHRFERGLSNVTAEYGLNEDGGVTVVNRGYSKSKREWQEAEGKAYFVATPDVGHLKVSFFGPFYGSYVVFDLDKTDYQYAFVSGPDTSYLWLLARSPEVDASLLERFRQRAQQLGFDTQSLILVDQSPTEG